MIPDKIYIRQYRDGDTSMFWDLAPHEDEIAGIEAVEYIRKETLARGFIVGADLVLRLCFIARYGNCWAHGDTLRQAVSDAGAKWQEASPLDERLAEFVKVHPELDEPYDDLFQWHHILTGSCEAGRKEWCRIHGYQPTDAITVRTFIEQTRNDYGRDAIAELAKLYKLN